MNRGIYFSIKFKSLFSAALSFIFVVSFLYLVMLGIQNDAGDKVISSVLHSDGLPLIIVDPGHGGEDGGTSSVDGINEKDINLAISSKLDVFLTLCGYDTIMTRTEDKLIYDGSPSTMKAKKTADIRKRMAIIESNPESVFLSIHQNYFVESKYSGAQVFYSPNDNESQTIAEFIQGSIRNSIQNDNERKIKKSGKNIYLLYHAKTPAVMVECGFMSNYEEARLLSDDEYQIKMSLVIIGGLNDYFKAKGEL